MRPIDGRAGLLALCVCCAAIAACGKRGNPLPPLVRLPAAPLDLSATRLHDDVYLRLTVPHANVDGVTPADIARVEVYALTFEELPPNLSLIDPEDVRESATLVASVDVRRPQPPAAGGAPPSPAPPSGVDQGAVVVVRERLAEQSRTLSTLPQKNLPASLLDPEVELPWPLMGMMERPGPQRYYFAVGVSPRGRYGPHTALVPMPLAPTSGAPSAPAIDVTESAMTLRWNAPADARGVAPPPEPGVLPSRSLVPGPPPTTYHVYEVAKPASPDAPLEIPSPLTPEPIGATELTQTDITFGQERCFYVRAVDVVDGVPVRGPASPVACADFADTFAPEPPRDLVGVSVAGAVSLIWEPSTSKDVAGYLVLRSDLGGDTLTPLTKTPVTGLSYRDETVRPGVRYVYAVVAVDAAGNRSEESNRVEERAQ